MRESYRKTIEVADRSSSHCTLFNIAYDHYLLSLIWQELDKSKRILEVGCGQGSITHYLDSLGFDIVGIDLQPDGWVEIREVDSDPVQFVQANAMSLPIVTDSVDLVLMWASLEHIGALSKDGTKTRKMTEEVRNKKITALEEVRRVGRSGAEVLITKYPNRYSMDKLYSFNRWFSNGKIYDSESGHQPSERARPDELRDLVSEQLNVKKTIPSGFLPQQLPLESESGKPEVLYTLINSSLSKLPIIRQFTQCYNICASVP
jgi:ubiquinone/menaquinone biosynthesis C-methylase UbiE